MSGRRVARVDAGLLSLTPRGSVHVRVATTCHAAVLSRCATLSYGPKSWDRARRVFLFHSLCSFVDSHRRTRRAHTHTRTHTLHACARAHARAYAHGHAAQAHALTHAKSDAAGRTRARTNDRSLYPSRFDPPSAAALLLPRSYVLLRYLHHHLPPFTLAHSFLPFYFSPSLSFSLSILLRSLPRTVAAGAASAPPWCARRSTSHPRSNATGTKGRSLVTRQTRGLRSRASSSRRHSRRVHPRTLSRVLRTPEFLYAVRTSCRESDSPRCRLSRSVEPT